MKRANHRLHPNAAIALQFHAGSQWRGVGEPCRSADSHAGGGVLVLISCAARRRICDAGQNQSVCGCRHLLFQVGRRAQLPTSQPGRLWEP